MALAAAVAVKVAKKSSPQPTAARRPWPGGQAGGAARNESEAVSSARGGGGGGQTTSAFPSDANSLATFVLRLAATDRLERDRVFNRRAGHFLIAQSR